MTRPNETQRSYLAMWALAAAGIALLVWSFTADARDYSNHVDTALVMAVDVSSSMDGDSIELARNSHAAAITSPEVLGAIERGALQRILVAYVEFAGQAQVVVGWTVIDGLDSANAFAAAMMAAERKQMSRLTCVACALETSRELFEALPYEPFRRVVDVAGDGTDNVLQTIAAPRAALLDIGATINGLPMPSTVHNFEGYYERELIGGPRAFSIPLKRIEDLPMLLRRKLITEIS